MAAADAGSAASPDAGAAKEECAWCKFMKGGPCRTVFEAWQACVDGVMDAPGADEGARQVAVEQCADVTGPLFACLVQHPDYYGSALEGMAARSSDAGAGQAAAGDGGGGGGGAAAAAGAPPSAAAAGSGSGSGNSASSSRSAAGAAAAGVVHAGELGTAGL